MKPILFLGDSHLSRLEKAYLERKANDAVFLCTPGPISNLVGFSGGRIFVKEQREYLKNHPQAKQYDFINWLDLTIERLSKITETTGVELSGYSAVVIVSYQIFNPEVWAEAALAYTRGQISTQVWKKHCGSNFTLNHSLRNSLHFKLLDEIKQSTDYPKIFSVATPARIAESDFPRALLNNRETGHEAFRVAETQYASLILEKYGSELVPYPDSLLSDDGLCTSQQFQNSKGDYTHLNIEGSRLWLSAITAYINHSNTLVKDHRLTPVASLGGM